MWLLGDDRRGKPVTEYEFKLTPWVSLITYRSDCFGDDNVWRLKRQVEGAAVCLVKKTNHNTVMARIVGGASKENVVRNASGHCRGC
jgi:hypothetical protein